MDLQQTENGYALIMRRDCECRLRFGAEHSGDAQFYSKVPQHYRGENRNVFAPGSMRRQGLRRENCVSAPAPGGISSTSGCARSLGSHAGATGSTAARAGRARTACAPGSCRIAHACRAAGTARTARSTVGASSGVCASSGSPGCRAVLIGFGLRILAIRRAAHGTHRRVASRIIRTVRTATHCD